MLLGCATLATASLAFIYAVKNTSPANAAFLGSMAPLLAVVLARFVLGELLTLVTVVAVAVGLVGVAITIGGDLDGGDMAGNIAALLAALGFAGYTVCVRSDRRRDWSPVLPGYGLLMIVTCGAITVAGGRTLVPPLADIALAAVHGGLFIVVGTLLYNHSSRQVPAVAMAVFAQTEMILVPVWAFLFLSDSPAGDVDRRRRRHRLGGHRQGGRRCPAPAHRDRHMTTATLAMYPLAPLRPAWDRLWSAVHDRTSWTPPTLTWTDDVQATWRDADCVVTHACGWPVAASLPGIVDVVGAFALAIPDAEGHRYRTVLMSGRDVPLAELTSGTAAVNGDDSLSGWISLRSAAVEGRDWPGPVLWTGAHVASLAALQRGDADVASIDPLTLHHVRRHAPALVEGLHVVGAGPLVPSPPIVVPRGTSPQRIDALRAAFHAALDDGQHADDLAITAFVDLDAAEYEPVLGLVQS